MPYYKLLVHKQPPSSKHLLSPIPAGMALHIPHLALGHLRETYHEIERQVRRARHVHLGDQERLREVRDRVVGFLATVEQVCRSEVCGVPPHLTVLIA